MTVLEKNLYEAATLAHTQMSWWRDQRPWGAMDQERYDLLGDALREWTLANMPPKHDDPKTGQPYESHWPWTVEEHLQNLWATAVETLDGKRPGINLAGRVQYNVKYMQDAHKKEIQAAMLRGVEAVLAIKAANKALGPERTPYDADSIRAEAQEYMRLLNTPKNAPLGTVEDWMKK